MNSPNKNNKETPALSVTDAQTRILEKIRPLETSEDIDINEALGRILSKDLFANIDLPPTNNSAMDGFAFRAEDLSDSINIFKVVGFIPAGKTFTQDVVKNECVKIMTGATMPASCDTVIPQEFVDVLDNGRVQFKRDDIQPYANCRLQGEIIQKGALALAKGTHLQPAHIGFIASIGCSTIPVQRPLHIALFSTGDELSDPHNGLNNQGVYDSNRYSIKSLLSKLDCKISDLGIIPDNPIKLGEIFRHACEIADVVITSGGVSVGEADYTKTVIQQLGDIAFWQINMRPGRPMTFGEIASNGKTALLFALPGNPVAAIVGFHFFVKDALLKMMGAAHKSTLLIPAISQSHIQKRMGRTEFQRGWVSNNDDGKLVVTLIGSQSSANLSSMTKANCIIMLNEDQSTVSIGDSVQIVLIDGMF